MCTGQGPTEVPFDEVAGATPGGVISCLDMRIRKSKVEATPCHSPSVRLLFVVYDRGATRIDSNHEWLMSNVIACRAGNYEIHWHHCEEVPCWECTRGVRFMSDRRTNRIHSAQFNTPHTTHRS